MLLKMRQRISNRTGDKLMSHSRHNRQQRAQISKQLPTAAPGISKVTPNTIRQRQLARGKGLASDFKHFLGSAKSSTSNVLARLGPRRRPDQEQL